MPTSKTDPFPTVKAKVGALTQKKRNKKEGVVVDTDSLPQDQASPIEYDRTLNDVSEMPSVMANSGSDF